MSSFTTASMCDERYKQALIVGLDLSCVTHRSNKPVLQFPSVCVSFLQDVHSIKALHISHGINALSS